MPELVPLSLSGARVSQGLQMSWSQHNQSLMAGGDSKILRLWDCRREMRICDIPSMLDTCVTNIQTGDNSHVVAVSFSDGHVKMFDTRSRACVMTSREHRQMVLGLSYQGNSLVTGCAEGVVKLWDTRQRQNSVTTHR